jgi:hypothetical protein
MTNLETYQETIGLLLEQKSKILCMSQDKQAKHLPKIDAWINELDEAIEHELGIAAYNQRVRS